MRDMRIEVYWKDELSSVATIKDGKAEIQYFVEDPVKCFFPRKPMDMYSISALLETRCYPRNRQSIDLILKEWGMKNYDPVEMCKITHGIMRNDYLWFRFDDEDVTYDDVKIRG